MTNRLWLAVLLLGGCAETEALNEASPTNGDSYAAAVARRDSFEALGDSLRSAANRLARLADSLGVGQETLDDSGVMERWDSWLDESNESMDRYSLFTGCAPVAVLPRWALLEASWGDINPYAVGALPEASEIRAMVEVRLRAARLWGGWDAMERGIGSIVLPTNRLTASSGGTAPVLVFRSDFDTVADADRGLVSIFAEFRKEVWDPLSGELVTVLTWEAVSPPGSFPVGGDFGAVSALVDRFIGEYLQVNEAWCGTVGGDPMRSQVLD